ncbi:MAG TPA: GNAT family protein [Bacillota bacterium]|jgi:RimJ/RimL family protein N-acetyltransferase
MSVQGQQDRRAFLTGAGVYLRPLERADLDYVRRWYNDPETRALTGMATPMSEAAAEEWYESAKNDRDRVWFMVVSRDEDRVIGEAGLLRMYHPWRTTDLTIIIGEPEARGHGRGTEAINLLLDYAFGHLGFHRVSIGVVGFNQRAIEFYERVGFKREGLQRDGYYYNHVFHDFVMMSILENDFRALRQKERPRD